MPSNVDLTPYRRYGRWAKRIIIFLAAYLLIGYLFIGVSPKQALTHPGSSFSAYRGFVVYLIFIAFTGIIYFVAIFWIMARGNDYVIYPGEYDVGFDDVRGQPAAVESTKEVLRLFQGFKNFKEMGGYPPHGILFEGPPGTGKTLMAKAIAGATGVPFLYSTGSGFANMFFGVGNLKVRHPRKLGIPEVEHPGGAASNLFPFVLTPVIRQPGGVYDITFSNQSSQTIGGVTYHSADLQIGIDPIVGKEQRVSFLLNQLGATPARAYTFSSEFRPADTHTITIRAIDVIPGTYLVRVQVDGVESRLEAPAGTYAAPTVTL